MKLSTIIKLSFNMLVHSKLRSWLTILGIFIGITAVVAIVSIGQGLQQSVNSQISGLGQDIITINAGSSRAVGGGFGGEARGSAVSPLSDREISALKLVSGIKAITGVVSGRATIRFQNQNASLSITGEDPGVMKNFITTSLSSGRFLNTGDVRVALIGNGVANSVFSTPLSTGSLVNIGRSPFRIVGLLSSASGFGGGGDNNVYVSISDARNILNNTLTLDSNQYSEILVQVNDASQITTVSSDIEQALINSRHVTAAKEDFSISTAQALQQRFSSVTSSISIFLAIIAGVSLLVGGIGVANTMFTSVLEKTRDIGIMKAIGAKNSDILLIFLINSGMLGFVGGVLGVIGGALASLALPVFGISINGLGGRGGLHTLVSPQLLLFAILFSVGIGMVSGAWPAYRASKLKPVDALRYE